MFFFSFILFHFISFSVSLREKWGAEILSFRIIQIVKGFTYPPPPLLPPFTSSSITIQTTSVALQFSVRSSQVWLSSPMTSTVREGSQPWCTTDLLHSSRSQRKKILTWKIVPVSSVVHFTSTALKHVRHSKESESTI